MANITIKQFTSITMVTVEPCMNIRRISIKTGDLESAPGISIYGDVENLSPVEVEELIFALNIAKSIKTGKLSCELEENIEGG